MSAARVTYRVERAGSIYVEPTIASLTSGMSAVVGATVVVEGIASVVELTANVSADGRIDAVTVSIPDAVDGDRAELLASALAACADPKLLDTIRRRGLDAIAAERAKVVELILAWRADDLDAKERRAAPRTTGEETGR